MDKAYKVVQTTRDPRVFRSALAKQEVKFEEVNGQVKKVPLGRKYKVGVEAKASKFMHKLGYDLLVFGSSDSARNFELANISPNYSLRVFEAEVTGLRNVKVRKSTSVFPKSRKFFKVLWAGVGTYPGEWPNGTMMADTVKLIQEV